ncbi:HAD superfamily hydrolase (TIGR01549 family) [Priestia taiwanensis]|nr:HAD superfamily hydrolase (TIGR01549 family) [Priestia taiwanensis]
MMVRLAFFEEKYREELCRFELPEEQAQFTGLPSDVLDEAITSGQHPIVMVHEDTPVGFFVLKMGDNLQQLVNNERAMLIRALSVNTAHQGKGYAKVGMLALPAFVREHFPEVDELVLAVNMRNIAAQKLYEHVNFVDKGIRREGPVGMQKILQYSLRKEYKLVLFDLDGTLTDPKEGIINSVQYALRQFGVEEKEENLLSFIGPPLQESFAEHFGWGEEQVTQAITYYREYFSERGMIENEVYEGISQLLEMLREEEKTLVVATSKPTVFAEKIAEHFQLSPYFSSIVGSNLDGTRRDKAEIIAYILEQYPTFKKDEIVMIGDRKHDLIGAMKNGVDSVGVEWGYGDRAELESAKATHVVASVEELQLLLKKTLQLEQQK